MEVNPLLKTELKWSEYRKVPVALVDGEQLNDSSEIITRLAADPRVRSPQAQHSAPQKSLSWRFWRRAPSQGAPADDADSTDEERW